MFGKPQNLLYLEDIVIKVNSEVLENIFFKACHDFNLEMYKSKMQVLFSERLFDYQFKFHV